MSTVDRQSTVRLPMDQGSSTKHQAPRTKDQAPSTKDYVLRTLSPNRRDSRPDQRRPHDRSADEMGAVGQRQRPDGDQNHRSQTAKFSSADFHMPVIPIAQIEDARQDDYRNVSDAELLRRSNLFLAEGRLVVRRLLSSPYRPVSTLLNE